MRTLLRVGLVSPGLLVLWIIAVFVGTSEGWWRKTLAPRRDTAGFMSAAVRLVDSSNKGNAVFAILEDLTVRGTHAVTVGEAVDVNTAFQTASLSKWITAWGVMALVQEGKLDVDAPAFSMAIPEMLRLIRLGSLVIVLSVSAIAWSIRGKRRGRSVNARAP